MSARLEKPHGCERGEGIPAGFVPHSTFWVVDEREVVQRYPIPT